MTLRSIVQLRVANALTTKPPSLSPNWMQSRKYENLTIVCITYRQDFLIFNHYVHK